MPRVRHIEIKNFRCIKSFEWWPSPGINCLIGPGDSGKSSILDAIDLCLSARRAIQFTDADFHLLDVSTPLSISITIGELDDALKNIDTYGIYLRSFNATTRTIEDEPEKSAETVLTLNLSVSADLEPVWTLLSDRAAAQGQSRYLSWGDRVCLSPTRLGAIADYNLAWRRQSVLRRLTDEKTDASAALAKAARDARAAFGDLADSQLRETLRIVSETAKELGILTSDKLKAMLDVHSVSFGDGTVSLHNENGVPLRSLGTGSTHLLVAGLQRKAAKAASVILIDELEYGLEPHRIIRLLGSIGAKESEAPLQAFMTTHSPVALRELSGDQLFLIRKREGDIQAERIGTEDGIQSTIRVYPDAFLAPTVIVCEGSSEVGLLRGLDQFRTGYGVPSITASGVALVDAVGCDSIYKRANSFAELHYRTAVLRDDDKQPDVVTEEAFVTGGGKLFKWRAGRALEDELFLSLSDRGVSKLLEQAIAFHGDEIIDANIRSESTGQFTLERCRAQISWEARTTLGKASRTKKNGWFKSVTWMEAVGRDIVGPDLDNADRGFQEIVTSVFVWISDVRP